ncbi:hypothetical protein QFC19_003080 [Naganishia cerealis]|uniref:Uncharacterized protein n=1 Tax=Naganishia cerealis TaxID=610337 RepID=A0ACC2W6N7_9TREE|nr:hypothetical protein QFC19_003080 [Naganishia cerealis]
MPSFFTSLTQIFSPAASNTPHASSNAQQYPSRQHPTLDPFSLPQHQGLGGYGGTPSGYNGAGSRSGSPAFGHPTRPGGFHSEGATETRQNSLMSNASTYSGGGGHTYPPISTASGYNSNAPALRPPPRSGSSSNFLSPHGPLIYYPPLNQTWTRIKRVIAEHVPELLDSLNPPIDPMQLKRIEGELGFMLPPSVRDSYLCADGQDPSADFKEGMFFGLTLLPLEDVLREWSFWRRVEYDPATGQNPDILVMMSSIPPGWVKPLYACRGWLPLIADKCGNYVGVDLDPPSYTHGANGPDPGNAASGSKPRQSATGGSWGQVILFGRDFDRKCVLWQGEGEGGWGRWLAKFAEELESGEGWETSDRSISGARSRAQNGKDSDEESEDDIGYSSYYFDGGGATSGDSYGSGGQALRLTGEYRGWGVMEAWWDRSVRKWEELGLGLQPEELKRQQEEIEKSKEQTSAPGLMGLGFGGMRIGAAGEDAQVAIPVLDDPNGIIPSVPALLPPPTPTPETSLLASRSPVVPRQPDDSTSSHFLPPSGLSIAVNGMERRESSNFRDFSAEAEHDGALRSPSLAKRLITPLSPLGSEQSTTMARNSVSDSEYNGQSLSVPPSATVSYADAGGWLSPHPQSPPHRRTAKRVPVPAPAPLPLDLPTRADVQAAEAVASAEARGLRGGWVMSMEAVGGQNPYSSTTSSRRSTVSTIADDIGLMTMSRDKGKKPMRGDNDIDAPNGDSNPMAMVDIDLEGGRSDRFGSNAGPSRYSMERTSGDLPRLSLSRRSSTGSGSGYPGVPQIRTPSPLSMIRQNDTTPRPVPDTRNSAFFTEGPFKSVATPPTDKPPVPRKSEDVAPEVPEKEQLGDEKKGEESGVDMQEIAI